MRSCPKCKTEAEVLHEDEPDVGIMVPLYCCRTCKIQFFWDYYHDELCVLDEAT